MKKIQPKPFLVSPWRSIFPHKKTAQRTALFFLLIFSVCMNVVAQQNQLQPSAVRQIQSLMAEKESRTPAQQKINSQILYEYKMLGGKALTSEIASLQTDIVKDAAGKIKVEMNVAVSQQLLQDLKALGAEIIFASEKFGSVTAKIPLDKVEQIAELDAVKHIEYWMAPMLSDGLPNHMDNFKSPGSANGPKSLLKRNNNTGFNNIPGFETRAAKVREAFNGLKRTAAFTGSVTSEGDATHKAALARSLFGVNGAGVKIGVISDSYNTRSTGSHEADDIASGDLPGAGNPNGFTTPVTVLEDFAGGTDEGRAMMQIVHDLAPGAQLYFATANVSEADFAQNILNLRTAGCDIIVDDVSYYDEGVFQDGIVAQSVNTVTASGALYFSSAGNSGNKTDGTAGVWEGDFNDGGALALFPGGTVHNFSGGTVFNTITATTGVLTLKWSDPLGASGNDYDLYVTNAAGTAVVRASTAIQNGDDNPYEAVNVSSVGQRIYIFRKTGAATRALHLNSNRGQLTFTTTGVTFGHNAAANTITVAATPAAGAFGSVPPYTQGPYPNAFNSTNKAEIFTSDGPRRIFYTPAGVAITPGNVLYGTNGGTVLQKPDITAADGVVTTLISTSGLNPFYGTSAAAPHAAAIAGLIKSKLPALTPAQIKTALVNSAIDIEASGVDINTGAGIVMAYEALIAAGATATISYLNLGTVTAVEGTSSNGNGILEPGESGSMTVQLKNLSNGVAATGVTAVLTSSTPGVTISQAAGSYGNIPALGAATNAAPYTFNIGPLVPCGSAISFTLTVTYGGSGAASPKVFNFTVGTGAALIGTISATLGSAPPTGAGFVSSSGNQTGRINRFSPASSCSAAKVAPGYQSATGARAYHAYTFTNTAVSSQCVTVTLAGVNAVNLFTAAYNSAGFIPATPNNNYLADPGASSSSAVYSFNAPAGQSFTIVVHEVTGGAGVGTAYTLNVNLSTCAVPICVSPAAQPYIASVNTGNQAYRGELGLEFTVKNPSGITIKQLGAFDDKGNGITGLQPGGGVRVAIFNRATHAIVPGLDATIVGLADAYTGNHRMKNITPVLLPLGDYMVVAKGYGPLELNGNQGSGGGPYPEGDKGNNAISLGAESAYGADDPNGFFYPSVAGNFGSDHQFLAGTFLFTTAGPCFTSSPDLFNLSVSQGTLTPAFNAATTSYAVSVANTVSSITVTPTALDPGATVKVNGVTVASATASAAIPLVEGSNNITVVVTASDATTKTYTITVARAASGLCKSPSAQAYTANTSTGNQPYRGELGMEFMVNNTAGIVIDKLGAFDDGANGITGTQSGGVRVAIFNRTTHTIVPGLDVIISGSTDPLAGNHRMHTLAAPITLSAGDYVIVAKGYSAAEKDGNIFNGGGPFPAGNDGGGAISFGSQSSYGADDPTGFSYPSTEANFGSNHVFMAGTFSFATVIPCGNGVCESAPAQAYVSNISTGSQAYTGELGMEFIVNNPAGINIKQLGAFDDGGNGITGQQPGNGVRVVVFNRTTHLAVPGLDATISGLADAYTGLHRMKNITPVLLPAGDYVIVAKGYGVAEKNGNIFSGGGPFPTGDNASGAITFGAESLYGPDNPAGFNYPTNAANYGDTHVYLAGTFGYTSNVSCAATSAIVATDISKMASDDQTSVAKPIVIYPNPSRGHFNLQLANVIASKLNVQIISADGKLVQQKTVQVMSNTALLTIAFDMVKEAPGIYLVKIQGSDGIKTEKLVIQR